MNAEQARAHQHWSAIDQGGAVCRSYIADGSVTTSDLSFKVFEVKQSCQ